MSFGTAVGFNGTDQANFSMCAYDPYTKNVAIAYGDIGNSGYGTFINGTVSGTTISFSTEVVFEQPGYTQYISMAADTTNNKMVVSYQDFTNTEQGTACVLTSAGSVPNLTAENFIGFSDSTYADTQSASIDSTCSINTKQTGLTTGSKYYVQIDGTLSTNAGTPSVEAGLAISATEILVKG